MARYWFRQKAFGYGATPNTWQGWVFTVAATGLIVVLAVFVRAALGQSAMFLAVIAALIPFCAVCWRKTEGGWRWRNGDD